MTSTKLTQPDQAFLNQEVKSPAFSLFFRIHSGSEKQIHDAGHIRNRAHETFKESGLSSVVVETLTRRVDQLIDKLNFQTGAQSVGLFVSPDESHLSQYYVNIPERQYIGDYFSSYESIYAQNESAPYLLFLLEPAALHLYRGQGTHLESLSESKETMRLLSVYKQRSTMQADKDGKVRKGHEYDSKWKNELFKAIADLCSAERVPAFFAGLNLAGTNESELRSYGIEVLAGVEEVHQRSSAEALKTLAEKLIVCLKAERSATLIDQCQTAEGNHKLATGLDEISACAKEGRGEVLILETPEWETAGKLELGALHEAIRETKLKHGKVEFVPEGTISKWNGAAMILRY